MAKVKNAVAIQGLLVRLGEVKEVVVVVVKEVVVVVVLVSGGTIDRKLDCSACFGPSSDQSNLPSIARSLPSDNENKHDQTAAILKDTFDRQDTL